jgi:hypothetical protein
LKRKKLSVHSVQKLPKSPRMQLWQRAVQSVLVVQEPAVHWLLHVVSGWQVLSATPGSQ